MSEHEERQILGRFARSLKLSDDATLEDIHAAIDRLPEDGAVHPQDIRDELEMLLSGKLTLAA